MFVVDTNVLIYAADRDAPEHAPCRALLEGWRRQAGAWYLTWGIVYEFLRVTTHPGVFHAPWTPAQAWTFVEAVLASPALRVLAPTSRHPELLGRLIREVPRVTGNLFHDAHTAVLMQEHGVRAIYTRDTDFHRFPFLEVIDPLAA
ncbi:MAG: type II toxin-antitoxin system VapC family toxin [Chloroflexi bacterium]|nr:type II toxin-antitoxin system VapC family toxin [Chloroflexota bacterium]